MVLAIIGIVAGEIFLIFDLANRIFGSYARRPGRTLWRVAVVVVCLLVLPAPLIAHELGDGSAHVHVLYLVAGAAGWLVALHFLMPYKWGIRRVPPEQYHRSLRPLGHNVLLRDSQLGLAEMPAGTERLVIVVLTDLHCNTHRKARTLMHLLEVLDEEELFDLVFVLGDLGENADLLPEVMQGLGAIRSRLGVYCVRGNHDFGAGRASLISELALANGIHLLANAAYEVPGTGIALVGLELPWDRAPLPEPVRDCFAIGLSHTPDNIRQLSRLGVNLSFAGHTHGGRLRIPLLGWALVPGRLGRFLERGLFRHEDALLYVASGIGYHVAPLGKKGEILRLTLTRPGHGTATDDG